MHANYALSGASDKLGPAGETRFLDRREDERRLPRRLIS